MPIEPLPEAPTLDTLKEVPVPLETRSLVVKLFRECQKTSPLAKKSQNWLPQLFSSVWAILSFIDRLPRALRRSSTPIYRLSLSTVEDLYFDNMVRRGYPITRLSSFKGSAHIAITAKEAPGDPNPHGRSTRR